MTSDNLLAEFNEMKQVVAQLEEKRKIRAERSKALYARNKAEGRFRCEVCDKDCATVSCLRSHQLSKSHQLKLMNSVSAPTAELIE